VAAWYQTDRLGSVREILNSTGTISDRVNYDGFGNVTSETAPGVGDRWKWTGREQDGTSGLQYNRARYFDGSTARWISQDPARWSAGDVNLYRYTWNASTSFTDPSGMGGVGGGGGGSGGGNNGTPFSPALRRVGVMGSRGQA
jgi:RHS repeat-associated protein